MLTSTITFLLATSSLVFAAPPYLIDVNRGCGSHLTDIQVKTAEDLFTLLLGGKSKTASASDNQTNGSRTSAEIPVHW
jgi:hypothetical protein